MDPDKNKADQIKIAKAIKELWDECSDDHVEAHFTDDQLEELTQRALVLAELALELFEWQEGRAA